MSVAEQSIAGAEARGHGFLASSVGRKIVMAATGIVLGAVTRVAWGVAKGQVLVAE